MRKKFIGVYALMAVLALGTTVTSCVDDTESPTVTAIRDAKLKQLQALASQAESQAKIDAIEAQIKEATSAAELAKLQAELEAAIAQANTSKQQAEQDMANSLNNHQSSLYQSYTNIAGQIAQTIKEISGQKMSLLNLKADSLSAATYAETLIADKKLDILEQETLKAGYEKWEKADFEALQKAVAEALVEKEAKENVKEAAVKASTQANKDFTEARASVERRYMYENGGSIHVDENEPSSGVDYKTLEPEDEVAKAAYVLKDLQKENPDQVFDDLHGTQIVSTSYKKVSEDATTGMNQFEIRASVLPKATRLVEEYVSGVKEELGTEKDDETKDTAYGRYAQLKKNAETALKNLTDAQKADPDGDHSSLEKALESANAAVARATEEGGSLYYAIEAVKDAEEFKKAFDAAVAVFNDAAKYKAYTDKVAAILAKEGKAVLDAEEAEWVAMQEYYIAEANYTAANNLLINADDVDKLIIECETQIEVLKKDLLKYENLYFTITNNGGTWQEGVAQGNATYEALVAAGEYELAYAEAKLELQKAMAEQYKSQLEASLKGEEPAPAE